MVMSDNKHNWEVVAHDYNSPYLRNRIFVHSFTKYPALLNIPKVAIGIISKNNQIEYLADMTTWTNAHEVLKAQVVKDFHSFEALIDKSVEHGEKMNDWTENNIFNKDLVGLSGDELISLYKTFADMQENEYAYGTALPVLDYQNFSFIEGNLNRILKENAPEDKFQDYYSVFTEPEHNSFAQDQEESLLQMLEKYWGDTKLTTGLKTKSLDEIRLEYKDFYSDLSAHTKKYSWVYYVYMGPAFTEKDFLGFVIDYINKGVSPEQKLREFKEKRARVINTKKEYLKSLGLTGIDEFVMKIAGKVVWAKPRRKDYQSKSYYHVEKLCREIAKRLFISLEQVRSAPVEQLEAALKDDTVDLSETNNIKKIHVCLPQADDSVMVLTGKDAEEFSSGRVSRGSDSQDLSKIKELKGSVACPGKVTGRAKIINLPEEMSKMEQGDILVSSATAPSIVPAMKKAAAIITDEGGLTCHAAIVSRELNTPCVVGLKIITRVVKDNDLVEVDANSGVVKILNK